ncbi:MAG: lytic transglycosylase domain-containing protein [Sphingomicrobium sp.]|nr:lytic transglycosylase domain-containing protein [Sphingomonadales bacterium]
MATSAAGPARADVIEIGQNGAAVVRAADRGWAGHPVDANTDVAADLIDTTDAPSVPAAAITSIAAPAIPEAVHASFLKAASASNVSPALLEALVWKESRWRPNAVSPKGALGLTQLMPGTARDLLVDPRDYSANLQGGARYLRQMLDLFDGDIEKALAAYNAGPGRVRIAGGIPAIAETRAYVSSIIDRLGRTTADLSQGANR